MTTSVAALLLVAFLTACSTTPPPRYHKPGVAETQLKRDEAECAKVALGREDPARPVGAYIDVDRDVADRCMMDRGYAVQR
jgi:hypothetical protein